MERINILTPDMYYSGLRSAVTSVWQESTIRPGLEMPTLDTPQICVAVCPLYAPSLLVDSQLILPPYTMNDSRVATKNLAYFSVLTSVVKYFQSIGGKPTVHMVFANRGVLLGREPKAEDEKALEYHDQLYFSAITNWSAMNAVQVTYNNYDSLLVDFPKFVNLRAPAPLLEGMDVKSQMIESFNHSLEGREKIVNNKDSRAVIKRLLTINGLDTNAVYWLTAGYLAFDHKIADIVGHNGIYLVSERFEPLFSIAKLTPSLYNMTRVQIKA